MKTKKMKLFYFILMLLPLVVTLIALCFLPDQIPAHYGLDGQVNRWGSKYETLLFPPLSLFMGLFMLALAKWSGNQEKSGTNNERTCLLCGLVSMVIFNAMTYFFLYTSFRKVENLSSISIDLNRLLFGILGIGMVVVGNVMPKLRQNSMIGLRTPWSRKDEATWKKCQRFGGISFIVGGLAMVAACFLTKGTACFLWSMGILVAVCIVDVIYTYQAAKKGDAKK